MKTSAIAPSLAALATLSAAIHAQCPDLGPASLEKLVVPSSGLLGSQIANGDQAGIDVDISGDVAVVGAWLQDLFAPGDNTGAAYVYERDGGCWVMKEKLVAPVGMEYGRAVAVDGDRIIVANWKEHLPFGAGTGPGTVYVYEKDASDCWKVTAKLQPNDGDGEPWDLFGADIDIEGDRVLIGAREDNAMGGDAGAVYIFEHSNDMWTQTAKILPPGGSLSQFAPWFGNSVSLSGDRILVGEWSTTCEPGGACITCVNFDCGETCDCDSGAAYVYDLSPTSGVWNLSAKLTASNAALGDGFGSVALSGDIAVVGAYETDAGCPGTPANCNSGSAYVFERDMSGSWNQTAILVASDAASNDNFGYSVSVAARTILVGARNWDGLGTDTGTAYVFAKQGANWTEVQKLTKAGVQPGSRMGNSTALSEDGRYALLGAPGDDGDIPGTGAAYVLGTTLTADKSQASISGGETVTFSIWAGQEPAKVSQPYFLLGSSTGSCPGFIVDGLFLPLNFDAYTIFTLSNPNTPPLSGSFGSLDGNAEATATFTIPGGTSPSLAGASLQHAVVVLDLTTLPGAALLDLLSNAAEFQLVP